MSKVTPNTKVTIFKDVFDSKNPHHIEIAKVLDRIKTGKTSKSIIEKLIQAKTTEEKADLKKKLPLICFSGEFNNRSNNGVNTHSGIICLDFDHLGDRLPKFRERVEQDKYTLACFLSPRRDGLKVLVKIPMDITNHSGYFEGLKLHFKDKSIDDDSEIARGCYESYDPNIYINFNSVIFDILIQAKVNVPIDLASKMNKINDFNIIYSKIKKWAEKNFVYEDGNKYRFLVNIATACNRFGLPQEFSENKLIEDYQSKASFVKSDDFKDIVNRIYISYNNQFEISWFTDKGEMNDFNPTGPARDVIYLNDIRKDMTKSFLEGDSKGDTTYFKSVDQHWSWKKGELILMGGIANHGKALCINTDIPTVDGWKKMKDIITGDKIFDENGNICNVTFVTEIMQNRNCFEVIFNDGTKIIADEEHLWFTHTEDGKLSSVKTTKEIEESLVYAVMNGENIYNHFIKFSKSIKSNHDDYNNDNVKINTCDDEKQQNVRHIISCISIKSVPVKCIQVDSPNKLYLCTKSFIATHNTTLMLQLCLIKSIKEGAKWGIFSPEQNPPIDFYKDLVHTYIGKSTERYHYNQMTIEEYNKGMDFISEHFYFIYPKDESPTPEYINERFGELIVKHKIVGCITDPYNQLDNDYGKNGRDDIYISSFLTKEKRFALNNDVYKIIIAHPRGNLMKQKGNYECPDVYDLAGGAMWNNKCDNILATYRPFYNVDKTNPLVEFRSQKIKKQKYVGIPGTAPLHFDIWSNRYLEFGEQQTVVEKGKNITKWVGLNPLQEDYAASYARMVKGTDFESNSIVSEIAQRRQETISFIPDDLQPESQDYNDENYG